MYFVKREEHGKRTPPLYKETAFDMILHACELVFLRNSWLENKGNDLDYLRGRIQAIPAFLRAGEFANGVFYI